MSLYHVVREACERERIRALSVMETICDVFERWLEGKISETASEVASVKILDEAKITSEKVHAEVSEFFDKSITSRIEETCSEWMDENLDDKVDFALRQKVSAAVEDQVEMLIDGPKFSRLVASKVDFEELVRDEVDFEQLLENSVDFENLIRNNCDIEDTIESMVKDVVEKKAEDMVKEATDDLFKNELDSLVKTRLKDAIEALLHDQEATKTVDGRIWSALADFSVTVREIAREEIRESDEKPSGQLSPDELKSLKRLAKLIDVVSAFFSKE